MRLTSLANALQCACNQFLDWRRHNRVEGWVRQNPDANGTALDIEDLGRLGRGGGPCPFYTARALADTAELVFMPYNYLARP